MSQNAMRLQWTTEEVDNKLKVKPICVRLNLHGSIHIVCPLFYVLRKLGGSEFGLHCLRPATLLARIRVRMMLHANKASHVPPEYLAVCYQ